MLLAICCMLHLFFDIWNISVTSHNKLQCFVDFNAVLGCFKREPNCFLNTPFLKPPETKIILKKEIDVLLNFLTFKGTYCIICEFGRANDQINTMECFVESNDSILRSAFALWIIVTRSAGRPDSVASLLGASCDMWESCMILHESALPPTLHSHAHCPAGGRQMSWCNWGSPLACCISSKILLKGARKLDWFAHSKKNNQSTDDQRAAVQSSCSVFIITLIF